MSHSCIDRHTDNVTTSACSVHPLLAHKHEDADAIHQLCCQWCFGPCHAKHESNAASVRRYCAPVTGRLASGWCPISCSPLDWGRDCLVAIDPVEWKLVLLAREVAQCHVPDVQERCPVEKWRTRPTRCALWATAAVTGACHGSRCHWLLLLRDAKLWNPNWHHNRFAEGCSGAQQTLSSNFLLLHGCWNI